jgi:hypothetical protein
MILIGISGKKLHGKSTVADMIENYCIDKLHIPVKKVAFADELKQEVALACDKSVQYIEENKQSFRTILQWWGTEFRRKQNHEDYWIYRMIPYVTTAVEHGYGFLLIPDVRFHNEAQYIRSQSSGVLIRVNRSGWIDADQHPSECDLDNYTFDHTINNIGSLDQLQRKVIRIVNQIHKQKASTQNVQTP